MSRKVLCPSCGSTVKTGLSPLPPRCPICKAQLPFTLPRTLTYVSRTFWRLVVIAVFVTVIMGIAPQISQERKRNVLGNLGHALTFDAFRVPHPPPR